MCRKRRDEREPPAVVRLVAAAALVAVLGSAAAPAASGAGAPAGDARAIEAQRRDLKQRVESIQRELAAAESNRTDAADALKATATAISAIGRRLHDLAGERRDVEKAIATLENERSVLAGQVAAEQALLARLLMQQRSGGEDEPLKLLLSGRDPADVSRMLRYLRAIGEMRAKTIDDLRGHQQRLRTAIADQAARRDELARIARDERGESDALRAQRELQVKAYARAREDIRRRQKEIASLLRDDARLSRLIGRLAEGAQPRTGARTAASAPPPALGTGPDKPALATGSAPAPGTETGLAARRGRLPMPVRGEPSGGFGTPRDRGGAAWKGWFIRCAAGQEVRAIADGQVVYADWLRGFGNLLIIDHGDGYMSLYGNNDALLASLGSAVREGDAVAQAGTSGGNEQPGVYFEIRHQGRAMDPAPWIGH